MCNSWAEFSHEWNATQGNFSVSLEALRYLYNSYHKNYSKTFSLSSLAYLYLRLYCCLFSIFNFNEERLPSPLALSNVAQEGV